MSYKLKFKQKMHPCPECKKMSQYNYYPFCSKLCRSLDLSSWLSGVYRIKGLEDEALSEEDLKDS